jgi:predicted DNA binding CopG/RHH family protein
MAKERTAIFITPELRKKLKIKCAKEGHTYDTLINSLLKE